MKMFITSWRKILLQNNTKIQTFIGFSIKARKITFGANACLMLKKANLIMVGNDGSENCKKQAQKISNKLGCPLVLSNQPLELIVGKPNCKIIAFTDKALSKAILDNLNEDFSIYLGGNG